MIDALLKCMVMHVPTCLVKKITNILHVETWINAITSTLNRDGTTALVVISGDVAVDRMSTNTNKSGCLTQGFFAFEKRFQKFEGDSEFQVIVLKFNRFPFVSIIICLEEFRWVRDHEFTIEFQDMK